MFKIVRTAVLSAAVGLGAIAAMPASAEASNASFSFGITSGNGAVSFQFGPSYHPGYHPGYPRYHSRRFCTDGQALNKAANMGLRNARVARSTRNVVQVRGWSHRRGQSAITFSRAPHCPIIARY